MSIWGTDWKAKYDKAYRELGNALGREEVLKRNLADKERHLSSIRDAHDKLRDAIYPPVLWSDKDWKNVHD